MAEQLSLIPMAKSTFRLPRDLYRRLKISAIQENRSIAEVLIDAVELYLSRVETIHDESTRSA
jgi:predicted DNA-binding protein